MNNLENQEQEVLTVENQYWVDMNDSLSRLENNKDFQKVILGGYFRDKAINGVSLLANDQTIKEGNRPAVIESLIAISHLEDFFITIKNIGTVAPEFSEDED